MTDEYYYAALDLLQQLIETPSLSRSEAEAAELVARYLERFPHIEVTRLGNNIWARPKEQEGEKPHLLLNSHIDTVKPVEGWQRNPYQATQEEERIYGLGSNDAGASLVTLLHTFLLLSQREQPYHLHFLASCEEEVSGKGGIELALLSLPPIAFAVVGEPTQMQPATAEKGLMVLDCYAEGKAGHAARNEGINAIYKALPAVEQLRTFHFEKVSPLLGETKVSVTQIEAGTQHNVVPDRCHWVVDIRTNDCYTNREALELLQEAVDCRMEARSTRLNSSHTPMNHPFVERCSLLGLEPFGSPTLSDQALMPFPSVKMGPGNSNRSHTADEYIVCDEIRHALELYLKLLDGLEL